jgi:hypothetical protein
MTVYSRHAQIRNYNGEGFTLPLSSAKGVNPRLTSIRGSHLMAISLQRLAKG